MLHVTSAFSILNPHLPFTRPLAYSMLADLVHHVRQHLTPQQLSRSVHLFTCNMHDETLPHSIQTMCCKLLLNIIDSLPNLSDRALGRSFFHISLPFLPNPLRKSSWGKDIFLLKFTYSLIHSILAIASIPSLSLSLSWIYRTKFDDDDTRCISGQVEDAFTV